MKTYKLLVLLLYFLIFPFFYSCDVDFDTIDVAEGKIEAALEQVGFDINNSIKQINAGQPIFSVLGELETLLSQSQESLNLSVSTIIEQFTIELSSLYFCTTNYLASRVIQLLEELKAKLLGYEYIYEPIPSICQSSMYILDLNTPESLRSVLRMTGYDLNRNNKSGFTATLTNQTQLLEISEFNFQSNNELTLFIGYQDSLLQNFDELNIFYEETELLSMRIIKKRNVEPNVKEIVYTPNPLSEVAYSRSGNREFGKEIAVYIGIEIRSNEKSIEVRFKGSFAETSNDRSSAVLNSKWRTLYTSPIDYNIEYINGLKEGSSSLVVYLDTDDTPDNFYSEFGLLTVYGLNRGKDGSANSGIQMNFNPINVVLKQIL